MTPLLERVADRWDPPAPRWLTPGDLACAADPTTLQTPALKLLDAELVDLMRPDGPDKLMFFMPPQEGKSQRVSRRFVEWLLERDPTLRIGIVSYEAQAAVRWGKEIKRDIEAHPELFPNVRLRRDSRAAGRWETTAGGGVYCVGISGALTGRPIDVLVIDDPVKDRAAAESKTYRDRAWDWYESVGRPRLSARGKVAIILTRWHHDDLAGRLEQREPADWRIVSVPAIATGDDDPLGRGEGDEMDSAQKRTPGYFTALRQKMSAYSFTSLYQQAPTVSAGNLFKRADWRYWERAGDTIRLGDDTVLQLRQLHAFITVDLAVSTKTSADYTVAAAWGIAPTGELLLLDRARERVVEGEHFDLVLPLRQRWLGQYGITWVEASQFGTTLTYAAGRKGLPLDKLEADTDKVTRALVAAPLVRSHRVWLPREADWLDEWIDECAEFPKGSHDDQVDVLAYAARIAVAHWLPTETTEDRATRRIGRERRPDDGIDLMTAAW